MCLRGPNASLGCYPSPSTYVLVHPGDPAIDFPYRPHGDVNPGNFCANTYRLNADGSNTRIGHQCVDVEGNP